MDTAQLEQLVRTVTEEVVRVLSIRETRSPQSSQRVPDSTSSMTGEREQTSKAVTFDGKLLTEKQLTDLVRQGHCRIRLRADALVTPLAFDRARENGIELVRERSNFVPTCTAAAPPAGRKLVLLAAGTTESVREKVREAASSCGFDVELEVPAGKTAGAVREAVLRCANQVVGGRVKRAVIVDENAYSLAASLAKQPGIRASICWDVDSAVAARMECGGNVLILNNRQLGLAMLRRVVCAWLSE